MPYQPGPGSRSAGIIAQGWSNISDTILKTALAYRQNKEDREAADATALAMETMYKNAGAPMPEGWEKYPGMSTAAKKAFLGTAAMNLNQFQTKQTQDLLNMQRMAQIAQYNRGVNADDALGAAFQQAGAAAPEMIAAPGAPHAGQPFAQRLMQAAAQNPMAPLSEKFGPMMQAMARLTPDQQNQLAFQEDPITGTRFATYGNILSPSGVNPDKAAQVVPLTGPNGENLGYGLRNRTGTTPLKTGEVTPRDQYEAINSQLKTLQANNQMLAFLPADNPARLANDKAIEALQAELDRLAKGGKGGNKAGATDNSSDPLNLFN